VGAGRPGQIGTDWLRTKNAPGLSFTAAGWLHGTEIAAIATDT
jgi:hypothetical protein